MTEWNYSRKELHGSIRDGTYTEYFARFTGEELVVPSPLGKSIVGDAARSHDADVLAALDEAGARFYLPCALPPPRAGRP